ncbi:ROK family transcriptional regulator [Paucibacter sp. R3-3]|uniref:ROK family transcriptional regulator n=1 Tax=Roseateles agri TaxID=3098619 RepID=A0ABU5DQH1_9BURK|nr:ROK family transcriptional regulator [Paucibacter sp. R3-3]MDY0747297.1 ROK family transcriptional regulator [Paucibacter sp. R3-3]
MPRAVRHINEVRVIDALYRQGTSTRADLARDLGLMRSTVGNLIAGLVEQGIVLEREVSGSTPGGRAGRPGQHVQLNPGHSAIFGADIGIGHLSVVAVDLGGRLIESKTVEFEGLQSDVEQTVRKLADMVRRAVKRLPAGQTPRGLCVAAPGLIDRDRQVLMRAPMLNWHDLPVGRLLRDALKWDDEVTLENDANAFAAAEVYGRRWGSVDEALFVYVDAGVGGGLVSQGKLQRGHNGYAGEIGHIHLGEQGFDPKTALEGSFESYVGRSAVLARYRHHGGKAWTLAEVVTALEAGQGAARKVAEEWAWWFGRGMASLISVLNPGRVVLGGAVAQIYRHVEAEVVASIRKHSVTPYPLPPLEMSTLGDDACAIGAAMTLHRSMLDFDKRLVFGGGAALAEGTEA